MVFDLVLPLGALQGEAEVNTLFEQRTSDNFEWAPEVEIAVTDGFALEIEFPFEKSDLEAYKFAVQYTFGEVIPGRVIHGAQGIGEHIDDESYWEWTLLYVPGVRFDAVWSALMMFGARHTRDDRVDDETEAIVNGTLFAEITEHFTVALEGNLATGGDETDWLVLPQVHYEFDDHWSLQAGGGATREDGDAEFTVAARLVHGF